MGSGEAEEGSTAGPAHGVYKEDRLSPTPHSCPPRPRTPLHTAAIFPTNRARPPCQHPSRVCSYLHASLGPSLRMSHLPGELTRRGEHEHARGPAALELPGAFRHVEGDALYLECR